MILSGELTVSRIQLGQCRAQILHGGGLHVEQSGVLHGHQQIRKHTVQRVGGKHLAIVRSQQHGQRIVGTHRAIQHQRIAATGVVEAIDGGEEGVQLSRGQILQSGVHLLKGGTMLADVGVGWLIEVNVQKINVDTPDVLNGLQTQGFAHLEDEAVSGASNVNIQSVICVKQFKEIQVELIARGLDKGSLLNRLGVVVHQTRCVVQEYLRGVTVHVVGLGEGVGVGHVPVVHAAGSGELAPQVGLDLVLTAILDVVVVGIDNVEVIVVRSPRGDDVVEEVVADAHVVAQQDLGNCRFDLSCILRQSLHRPIVGNSLQLIVEGQHELEDLGDLLDAVLGVRGDGGGEGKGTVQDLLGEHLADLVQ